MDSAEYFRLAEERFGKDPMDWAFVCPVCGHRQTLRDYKNAGAPESAVAFSCVGRWTTEQREAIGGKGKGPCNYAGGGLFRFNPVLLSDRNERYFALAEEA
jgi:hypothetical protein